MGRGGRGCCCCCCMCACSLACSRRDASQPSNRPIHHRHRRRLPLVPHSVHQHERHEGGAGCNVRVEQRVRGVAAAGEGGAGVETEPPAARVTRHLHQQHASHACASGAHSRSASSSACNAPHPQHTSANSRRHNIAVGEAAALLLLLVAHARAQDFARNQGGAACSGVYHDAASEVFCAKCGKPATTPHLQARA